MTHTAHSPRHGDKVAIIVDSENLYFGAQQEFNGRHPDYRAIRDDIAAERTLETAHAYPVRTEASEDFFEALRNIGFYVHAQSSPKDSSRSGSADADVAVAVKAMSLVDRVDTIALCSGDGDFAPLCDYVTAQGVDIEVWTFRESASKGLIEAATAVHYLTEDHVE